jgi:hypothetical protein
VTTGRRNFEKLLPIYGFAWSLLVESSSVNMNIAGIYLSLPFMGHSFMQILMNVRATPAQMAVSALMRSMGTPAAPWRATQGCIVKQV